jgi:FtsZ-binding cell division protein ZapB
MVYGAIAMSTVLDNRIRAMLPFRVFKQHGGVFLEYDQDVACVDYSKRKLPFQIKNGQPIIEPILRLMEMYSALEDLVQPLQKEVESLKGEKSALESDNGRLKKSVEELRRQNEGLRRERRG